MWRSRVIAVRRFQSAHFNSFRGFPQLHSKVHNPQTLTSYTNSNNFRSITSFPQLNAIRFFSSSSIGSVTDADLSTDNNNDVIGNEIESNDSFSIDEIWKNGINEVNSVLEMDVSDSESKESVESVEIVNGEGQEIDIEQLERVKSFLKGFAGESDGDSKSLESSLDDMNLNLKEEFVVRVLEDRSIPGENLVVFYKWAAGIKNEEVFSVTTRSLDALVRAVGYVLKKNVAYSLWDLVKEMGEKKNSVVTTEILNNLISLLSVLGKGMAGFEVFSKFGDFSCETNADSYFLTIEALCRRSIFDRVGLVCERMISEGKLPEAEKVGFMIYYLCKAGMVKEAYSVYLSAKEKQKFAPQKYVNLLFSSLCDRKKIDTDSVHLALNMLEDFNDGEKKKYAIKQFSCVIQGLCRVNDLEGAKSLLTKMIDNGPPPGNAVFNTIINVLSKTGNMEEAIKIMRIMEDRGLKPDLFAYSVIMSGYTKGDEMEKAVKMLTEAKKNHGKLTPVIYHTIIRGYCRLERFEKAVKLLEEMEEYGVRANTDEYNKLIQSLCLKAADWGMAEKLIKEMTKKGLHLNGITKSLVRAVKELEQEAKGTKEVSVEA